MKITLLQIFLQLVLIGGLSLASNYPVPNFSEANWDTVLFLTPVGIAKNMNAENPVMRSFYADVSAGQIKLDQGQIAIMYALYLAMLANAFLLVRRLRAGPA